MQPKYLNDSLDIIDNIIDKINDEEIFKIIIEYQNSGNTDIINKSKKILIKFINNTLNKIDITIPIPKYYVIFKRVVLHVTCIKNGNCDYFHFENILDEKHFKKLR